ncbi:MAG: hypothetical protein WAM60_02855 [Candidatus Promineifilaceae bacterium]
MASYSPTILYADQEHTGIRIVVPTIWAIIFISCYILIKVFLDGLPPGGIGDYALALSCVGALPISLGIGAAAEYFLKRRWPSGRQVEVSPQGLTVSFKDQEDLFVEWSRRANQTLWHFPLKGYPRGGRERRVPTNWLCLACQLQQDEQRFIVYSLMSKKQAEPLLDKHRFHGINLAEFFETNSVKNWLSTPSRPSLPANILTGKEGPYWLAERRRWEEGLELTPEDFEFFLQSVKDHFEDLNLSD